ncbi:MAG: hypothetical protein QXE23_08560 [Nitrososphaerota archaeon]
MSVVTPLLTLEEAARRLGIKPRTLIRYAKSGKIDVKLFAHEDRMLVALNEQINEAGQSPRREDFAHLDGCGISISDASEKYGVRFSTLQGWVQRGWIRILQKGGRGRPYKLNEADVAYLVAIFSRIHGERRGKRWKKDL